MIRFQTHASSLVVQTTSCADRKISTIEITGKYNNKKKRKTRRSVRMKRFCEKKNVNVQLNKTIAFVSRKKSENFIIIIMLITYFGLVCSLHKGNLDEKKISSSILKNVSGILKNFTITSLKLKWLIDQKDCHPCPHTESQE